ncbi:MAG: hypothetical protein KKB79_02615 [Nanoarchaeota archaeon]|nr:hypothetical protein [Nanoarchaeota archaeon]
MSRLTNWNIKRKQEKIMRKVEEEAREMNEIIDNGLDLQDVAEAYKEEYSQPFFSEIRNNLPNMHLKEKVSGAYSKTKESLSNIPPKVYATIGASALIGATGLAIWYNTPTKEPRTQEEESTITQITYTQSELDTKLDSTRTAVIDSMNSLGKDNTRISLLENKLNQAKRTISQRNRQLQEYETRGEKLASKLEREQSSVRAYKAHTENLVTRFGNTLGAFLTGEPDSAIVVENIARGNTITLTGKKAKAYDPRAQEGEVYIFTKDAEGDPKGFGYRLGEK